MMHKVNSLSEIQSDISSIKGSNREYVTNFYPDIDKLNTWVGSGRLSKEIVGNTAFILKDNGEFFHIFYCSASLEDLSYSLTRLKTSMDNTLVVVDIIGKESEVQSVLNVFKESGFYLYTTLVRMSRNSAVPEDLSASFTATLANISHTENVFNLLQRYFDPLAEQLPTQEDIRNWIQSDHLFVVEENGKIRGFVIFDIIGVTSYLRYWFVHPQHRNRKIGSMLMHEYFNKSIGTKRQLFWVIQSNENAIIRYSHYGFIPEKLKDYVMTNREIHYETNNN